MWQDKALEHAIQEDPRESCGLLVVIKGKEKYFPCKNLAVDPKDQFILDPDDWINAEDQGEIVAVFHSHPDHPPTPSQADLASCEYLDLPSHIYSVRMKEWCSFEPSGWKAPSLIGRSFIWGVHDCWSIIHDWYKETKNIDLKIWERPKRIKDFIASPMFEKGLPITGFKKQETLDDIQKDDVLLFQSITGNLDHVAVYIGDMMILNHNIKSLSCRELFDLKYQQSLKGVYRYAA